MGEMRVMGRQGDTRVTWDSEQAQEVEAAEATFKSYLAKGFAAFRVTKRDRKGSQIEGFDPLAEEILLVPPMAGG